MGEEVDRRMNIEENDKLLHICFQPRLDLNPHNLNFHSDVDANTADVDSVVVRQKIVLLPTLACNLNTEITLLLCHKSLISFSCLNFDRYNTINTLTAV